MLSSVVAESYEFRGAYNPRVEDLVENFVEKVKALQHRLKLKDVAIARAAFPGKSKGQKSAQRDFANYFSRIKREGINDPGIVLMRNIARGMGFVTLSEFVLQLERSPESPLQPLKEPVHNKEDKNQLPQEAADDRAVPTSRRQILVDFTYALIEEVLGGDLSVDIRQQDSMDRAQQPPKGKDSRTNR